MAKFVEWSNGNLLSLERAAFEFHCKPEEVEEKLPQLRPDLKMVEVAEAPVETPDEEPIPEKPSGFFSRTNTQEGGEE